MCVKKINTFLTISNDITCSVLKKVRLLADKSVDIAYKLEKKGCVHQHVWKKELHTLTFW